MWKGCASHVRPSHIGVFVHGSRIEILEEAMAALFTFFDWTYTEEGAVTRSFGLSEEQLNFCEIENNLYEEYGVEGGAYTLTQDENGNNVYTLNYDNSSDLGNALKFTRMVVGLEYTGAGTDIDYTLDQGYSTVVTHAHEQWTAYTSTAGDGNS